MLFVFDARKLMRETPSVLLIGNPVQNRASGLQAGILAIHWISSPHPSLIPLSSETKNVKKGVNHGVRSLEQDKP